MSNIDAGDVLLAIDTAISQHQAAIDSMVLARRMVVLFQESGATGADTIAIDTTPGACPHLHRQDLMGGGQVCTDCATELSAPDDPDDE